MLKKTILSALAALMCIAVFGSCTQAKSDIVMVSAGYGIKDGSFNSNIYAGITKFTAERGLSKSVINPNDSKTNTQGAIEQAVKNNAKIIIAAGESYSTAVFTSQNKYSEINFILVDALPFASNAPREPFASPNCVSISFEEQVSGFLAGYAAVKEGYTSLGFMGGKEVAAVTRYGYGFLQGIDYAGKELGLAAGAITVKYCYSDTFEPSDEVKAEAVLWYNTGTEVIFACGGKMSDSVFKAAEEKGMFCIGADIDQSEQSETVIISATKSLDKAVYNMLKAYYDGKFPGGQMLVLNAKDSAVGLSMDSSKLKNFTQADYNAIYARLMSNTDNIYTNIIKDATADGVPVPLIDLVFATATVDAPNFKVKTSSYAKP